MFNTNKSIWLFKNRTCLLIAAAFFLLSGFISGCGGGSSVAPPVVETGSITGALRVPVGSKPTSRIAETSQPTRATMPLEGAKVEAFRGDTKISGPEYSDDQGVFTLSSVPVGNCTLKINADGYTEKTVAVTVTVNNITSVGEETGVELKPTSSGALTISSNISGTTLYLDGMNTEIIMPELLQITLTDISIKLKTRDSHLFIKKP